MTAKEIRELAYRRSLQTDIFLYWHKTTNCLFIALLNDGENVNRGFVVPNDRGLDAFRHPFAYMPKDVYVIEVDE